MRIKAALLCDAATVRDGMLSVLSAGITRVGRGPFPAPLNIMLAVMVEADPDDVGERRIVVEVRRPGSDDVYFQVDAGMFIEDELPEDGAPRQLPFVLGLDATLPAAGSYYVRVAIEPANDESVLPFVAHVPQVNAPPP